MCVVSQSVCEADQLPSSCVRGLTQLVVSLRLRDGGSRLKRVLGKSYGNGGCRGSEAVTKALSHRFAVMCPPFSRIMLWVGPGHFRGHLKRDDDDTKRTNLNESRREKTPHNEKKNPFFSQATKAEREKSGFITAHKC